MALTEAGEVYSWGRGSDGALGTGQTEDVFEPVLITENLDEPAI